VSTLAFLAPDASDVAARSPTHRLALAAGARMERRDGWVLAVAYGDGDRDAAAEHGRLTETVGFADRSQLCKLELKAAPTVLADVIAAAGDGVALSPRVATPGGAASWWCPLTPSHVLALAEPAQAAALRSSLATASAEREADVTVVESSSGLAALTLAGPRAAELLARFCAIDVRPAVTPVAGFRPGSIARTPGYLLREREDELLILVGWALGEYLWQVVADAAEHLGGGPVGAEALAAHRERTGA
jgi:heterotetrameric sarcosine oxidase gamma subunit